MPYPITRAEAHAQAETLFDQAQTKAYQSPARAALLSEALLLETVAARLPEEAPKPTPVEPASAPSPAKRAPRKKATAKPSAEEVAA